MSIRLWHCGPNSAIKRVRVATRNLATGKLQRVVLSEFIVAGGSPLGETLDRYRDFFALFVDFRG
jgi:hypothetical protein